MTENIRKITSQQFHDWVVSIVNEDIFISRERLTALLAKNSPHEILEEEFREFFNGYYSLALELEEHEESVLKIIKATDALAHLKHRVSAVETQRRSSRLGREARRLGLSLDTDPVPEIKVAALSVDDFQTFMRTLGNWQLFASGEHLVKLMGTEESIEITERLRAEFCEFSSVIWNWNCSLRIMITTQMTDWSYVQSSLKISNAKKSISGLVVKCIHLRRSPKN